MSSLTIPCPKCGSGLKLPNRQLLGRKGKCPKCQHRFILEEPDEVELQLAEPVPPPTAVPEVSAPMIGTSPRWVPDAEQNADPVLPVAPFPPLTANQNPQGFPQVVPDTNSFQLDQPATSAAITDTAGVADMAAASAHELDFAATAPTDSEQGSVVQRVRGRRKKSRVGAVVVGIGTALFVASIAGLWWQQNNQAEAVSGDGQPAANPGWEQQKVELAGSNEDAKSLSPTSGAPVPLDFMPFTPHLIFHVRPSELWSQKEFVALTYDLAPWLAQKIRDITRFEPEEIEEVTFALNFGPRTSPPDVAAVVRLRAEQTVSDLQLNRFRGQIRPDLEAEVFESTEYSYMQIDTKTFVVAPVTMSESLAEAKTYSRPPSVDIATLHKNSDRTRQMTLMFDLTNIDTHREYVFGPTMQDLADRFVLWFGKEIQTVSWSFHLSPEHLHMETLLRPNNTSSSLKVQRRMQGQLEKLPRMLQQTARFMNPGTAGERAMIGRFPAMMKATALGTSNNVDSEFVRLVTLLPNKAAPNLAAGALLTWNESIVTDFTGPAPTVATGPAIPDKIADRLKMPVLVDFRRMPLQEAFAYVADEIKTPITINGDALKLSGMTQNMPQTYNLGEVSALKAIDAMITNPDYKGLLVIVVDEAAKTIQLTTRPVAEQAGLQIYDTSQSQ